VTCSENRAIRQAEGEYNTELAFAISVTADVYAHVSPAMLKGAAAMLNRIVESGSKASGD
jgi:hypothetical protein